LLLASKTYKIRTMADLEDAKVGAPQDGDAKEEGTEDTAAGSSPAIVDETAETDVKQDEVEGEDAENAKRKLEENEEDEGEEEEGESAKKLKGSGDDDSGPAPVYPSKEGTTIFNDADVLSGRGGGTNVHPGNRNFRDLINLHRRAYLKARKNDKPAISRAIVRSIRENNGRFLKKDEKSGLWFEIGDDAAREKTSQALRQRAPEMRKLLFDTEREEARAAAQEHLRQQRLLMGMPPEMMTGQNGQGQMPGTGGGAPQGMNMFPNPAMFAMAANQKGMPMHPGAGPEAYSQMFFMGAPPGGMNRFAPNSQTPAPPSGTAGGGGGTSS